MKIYELLSKLSFVQIDDVCEKHKMFHKTYVDLENTEYPVSIDVDVTIHSTMEYDYDFEIKINDEVQTTKDAIALHKLLERVIDDSANINNMINEMNEEVNEMSEDKECLKQ